MTIGNENAYPVISFDQEGRSSEYEAGLTKREYFAAMAMQGILSSGDWPFDSQPIVKYSISLSDALINELNKQP